MHLTVLRPPGIALPHQFCAGDRREKDRRAPTLVVEFRVEQRRREENGRDLMRVEQPRVEAVQPQIELVREQEERLAFLGYQIQTYKGIVFCLAGMIAGLSGGLYSFHEGFVGPAQLGPVFSTQVALYSMFGGAGTLIGAVIGTGSIEAVGYFVSQYWETGWPILLGTLLLAIVTYRPAGLISLVVSERERIGAFGGGAVSASDDIAERCHEHA